MITELQCLAYRNQCFVCKKNINTTNSFGCLQRLNIKKHFLEFFKKSTTPQRIYFCEQCFKSICNLKLDIFPQVKCFYCDKHLKSYSYYEIYYQDYSTYDGEGVDSDLLFCHKCFKKYIGKQYLFEK